MAIRNCGKNNGTLLGTAIRRSILATTLLAISTSVSLAADVVSPPQAEIQDQQRWRVIFSPYVWGASLNGSAGLFGHSTDVDVPFRDIFDNLDMSFMGEAEITNGTMGFYINGQYVKTSQGENIRDNELDLEMTTTSPQAPITASMNRRCRERRSSASSAFSPSNQRSAFAGPR